MIYLAIDTSTVMASLALVQDDAILAEFTWRCEQSHTVELLPNLTYLMNKARLSLQSVNGIVVAKGPGSFNGLRVGVSAAKGLAFSLSVPIVGVSTLEAAAFPHAEFGLPVCAVFNAGREEIAAAMYQKKRHAWQQLTSEHITTVAVLCSQMTAKTVFCGEFTPTVAARLRERLKQKAMILPPAARLRRAGFLAELGQQRLKAGDYDDAATLQPLYLRRPPITERKHQ